MSMIDRSLDGMASLSGQLGALLKRRLREVGGIALLSLAMMAALALATWSVQDPSPPMRRCATCSAVPAPSPPTC
jgi:S-DNA-T family DNA segregation ATPase FtsK/SpoIIIE